MEKIKSKIIILLTFCLVLTGILFNTIPISATSNPDNAPVDWAFEASSVELNDAIVAKYGSTVDTDGDGFISISEANAMAGVLDVSSTNISGSINGINNFIKIIYLNLDNNKLSGEIPSNISEMNKLQTLWLQNNQLTGEIPANIDNMISLQELCLQNNQLSGEIPTNIGNMTNLVNLLLFDNQLSGEIPASMSNMTSLKVLSLTSNQLSGKIPASIGEMANLQAISLGNNQLNGEIPLSIGNLSDLRVLYFSDNELKGEIPENIWEMTNLLNLNLANNQLKGEIPVNIDNLINLQVLNLANNQFKGKIPYSVGNMTNLQHLDLSTNQLSGEVPINIGNMTNLQTLSLRFNQLSGEIPPSISSLANLQTLFLNSNQLSGEIPTSIGELTNLAFLRLEDNQFTSIPQTSYDSIVSIPLYYYRVHNQTFTINQTIPSPTNTDYTFDGLPAYEQFPNYGITFEYSLEYPDGSTDIIIPTISNGTVTIDGSLLTQIGDYSLVATGTGDDVRFTNFVYTTNFSIADPLPTNEEIIYVSASANGKKDKETSTKILIDLSKVPEVGEITVNDIELTGLPTITKGILTSLGSGKYELAISGIWTEGTRVDVVLAKSEVIFTPDTQSVTLHTKANDNSGNNNENNGNNGNDAIDDKNSENLPQTGDSSASSAMMILLIASLITGSYVLTRGKKIR